MYYLLLLQGKRLVKSCRSVCPSVCTLFILSQGKRLGSLMLHQKSLIVCKHGNKCWDSNFYISKCSVSVFLFANQAHLHCQSGTKVNSETVSLPELIFQPAHCEVLCTIGHP